MIVKNKVKTRWMKMKYKVSYISGHDLKYKEAVIEADSENEAVEKAFQKEGFNFDNALVNIVVTD